jgi:hypothetical protein
LGASRARRERQRKEKEQREQPKQHLPGGIHGVLRIS